MSEKPKLFGNIPALSLNRDQIYNRFSPRSSSLNHSESELSSRSSDDTDSRDFKPSTFWRNVIAIVIMPFVLTGAPILSILFTERKYQTKKMSMVNWIKLILSDNFAILNAISLCGTLALNGWLLYLLFDILIKLFVLGQLSVKFVFTILEFLETIPIVLMVDIFWIKGFRIKQIIEVLNITLWRSSQTNWTVFAIKLTLTIVLCLILHIIDYLTFKWKGDEGLSTQSKSQYFTHLPHRLINTFLFPVYITICAAVHARNRRMNEYIRSLIDSQHRPDLINLRNIKNQFKTNGQLIRHINSVFNILMSVFVVTLMLGIFKDAFYSSYNLGLIILTNFLGINYFQPKFPQRDLDSGMIRCISADVTVVIMKFALVGLTIFQMIDVNHESRSAHIMINDLMSQFDHVIHRDLYQSYRLLRFYVKSRLDNTDRANLVYISIFSMMPSLKSLLLIRIT